MVQYDNLADRFKEADEGFQDITRPFLYSLIDKSLLDGDKLLDLGCGYGKDLVRFSQRGVSVYGVDNSIEMLRYAKENCPVTNLTNGLFESLPYEDNFFDGIFSRYAIQHAGDVRKVLKEACRVLKPKKDLVFLVTHPLRQFIEKERKDYWHQENVRSNILGGRVIVEEPSHTIEEYLSPFVLRNFKIKGFYEKFDPAAQQIEGYKYPGVLIICLEKLG